MGVGAFADGSKATITVNSGSITTTGPNGSAALAKAGGTVNLNGVAVSASGDDTRPTSVDGAGVGADTGRSEEHTSELQSLMRNSYAVFCLKKKNKYTRL